MNCQYCNNPLPQGASRCPACGAQVPMQQPQFAPPQYGQQPQFAPPPYGQSFQNYLWFSILNTVLCCLPAGIIGIVFSQQASSKYQVGDFAGAQNAGRIALIANLIGVGLGVVGDIIWLLILLLA